MRAALILFITVVVAVTIPYHPRTGWNVNTRLALIMAVIETGSFSIDPFHATPPWDTGDKALFEGRHYSDKTWGLSLPVLPVLWGLRVLRGEMLDFHTVHAVGRLLGVALPGAGAVVLFFLLAVRLGTPPRRALVLALMAFLGSTWGGYTMLFLPYAPGICALLGALWVVFFPRAGRVTPANAAAVGGLLGWAVLCDMVFAPAGLAVAAVWLLRLADQCGLVGLRAFAEMIGDRTRPRHGLGLAAIATAAGLAPLVLFMVYCWSIFGRPGIPYHYEADAFFREGMSRGVLGVGMPSASALYFLTVHPYRGILYWSPLVGLGVLGGALALGQYGKRLLVGMMAVGMFAVYTLLNAGYFQWWGGWAMGSRFMIPMIPLAALGACELLRDDRLAVFAANARMAAMARWAVVVAGVWGVAMCLPVALADPQIPQGHPTEVLLAVRPIDGLAVPQFEALAAVYTGRVTLWPWDRLAGRIASDARGTNVLGLGLYLLLVGGLAGWAWRTAPARITGVERRDYPFATRDGTAAPPPPRLGQIV
jgi:hypothetical protein